MSLRVGRRVGTKKHAGDETTVDFQAQAKRYRKLAKISRAEHKRLCGASIESAAGRAYPLTSWLHAQKGQSSEATRNDPQGIHTDKHTNQVGKL